MPDYSSAVERLGREHWKALIEGSVQGIVVHGKEFTVLFCNELGAEMMGFPNAAEAIGSDLFETSIRPEDRQASLEHFERVIRGEPVENPLEAEFRRRDGTPLWGQRVHTRVEWEGEPALLSTFIDVTERRRAEEALGRALEEVQLLRDHLEAENRELHSRLGGGAADDIVTEDPAFRETLRLIERVAPTPSSVLIQGETGTGKELLAKAVHELSDRRKGAFVKVNSAALPADLVESELFGHEKGAFTGAIRSRPGRFELADGGTLFLDEIGELSAAVQAKLLRVLQGGEFERVGSDRTRSVDVRIVAATHRDLEVMVERGEFRKDLYYRLSVFPIAVPPLRERPRDILVLARHFANRATSRMGRAPMSISESTIDRLLKHEWPGNVRELENVIERSVILSTDHELDLHLQSPRTTPDVTTVREMEEQLIRSALARTNFVIDGDDGAANLIGMAPSTLRRRVTEYGISRA